MQIDLDVCYAAVVETDLGAMLVAGTETGLRWIEFDDSIERLRATIHRQFPNATDGNDRPFEDWVESLCQSIDQNTEPADVPLDIQGTPFQKIVWKELMKIPAGCTETYAELASRIGKPTATRAVASACASNALAFVIPCHRIIRRDGGLGGYRWGMQRKERLLERERGAAYCESVA